MNPLPGANALPDNDPRLLAWGVVGCGIVSLLCGLAWLVVLVVDAWKDRKRKVGS